MATIKKDGFVKLYGSTPSKPRAYRVVARRPGHLPVERTSSPLITINHIYDDMVTWDHAQIKVTSRKKAGAYQRDINLLAERTVANLRLNGRASRYCDKAEDRLAVNLVD